MIILVVVVVVVVACGYFVDSYYKVSSSLRAVIPKKVAFQDSSLQFSSTFCEPHILSISKNSSGVVLESGDTHQLLSFMIKDSWMIMMILVVDSFYKAIDGHGQRSLLKLLTTICMTMT
jgi:hypothetical protein